MSDNLPIAAPSDESIRPGGFPWYLLVLGLLLLAHAMFGAYCAPDNETLCSLKLGVIMSQPVLLAIWAAFAQHRFYFRLLWALLLCTYLSFADDIGAVFQPAMRIDPGEVILATLALFVVTLPLLLLARRVSRCQISGPDGSGSHSVYLAHHYGIHHLLILTAIVALACGLVRSLLIITDAGFPYPSIFYFMVALGLLLILSQPASLIPWITLADRRKPFLWAFAALLIIAALDCAAGVAMALVGQSIWSPDIVVRCLLLQLGAVLSALGTTIVVRCCGFRMIRESEICRVAARRE